MMAFTNFLNSAPDRLIGLKHLILQDLFHDEDTLA